LSLKRPNEGVPSVEDRLHKVLANAGLGSRRVLEQRIDAGQVKVNGSVVAIGSSVRAGDRVELDGKLFVVVNDSAEHAQVLIYNKPEGVVSTREDPEGRPTVFEQLPNIKGARWISVGRLDINTTGLLLLTTDGALAHALMHPSTEIEREYICRVHGEVPDEVLEKLRSGVDLEDGPARFEELGVISRGDSHSWFRVVVREGRNREVRRIWESQGLMVSRLKRVRYGNIDLPRGLLRGQSQTLDVELVKALRVLVGALDPEPTLTVQPVINQRRAKPSNEFRPAPQSQKAWSGGAQDEAREIRAFDRIREDTPFRPGAKRKRPIGAAGKKPPRGGPGGPNARPGARPPRPGGPRGAKPGHAVGIPTGQRSSGPQIGIYQPDPRSWTAGDNPGNRRPPNGKTRGPRPPGGGNPGNSAPPGQRDRRPASGNGASRAPSDANRGNNGSRGNERFGAPRDNRFGSPNSAYAGQPGQGQRPFRGREEQLPRDDIGNRLAPGPGANRAPGGKPKRPFKPRPQ
jgi:23S rRNA pseudouridine2605 synthase